MVTRLCDCIMPDVGNVIDLLLSVKYGRGLLQGLSFGLDEEKEDVGKFKGEESTVYEVL